MRVLIVAATELEIPALKSGVSSAHYLDVLITGVGMVATAAGAARAMASARYDVAFNFGVCGSFDATFAPGDVVHITSDRLAELGVEDGDRFLPIEELGLGASSLFANPAPPNNPVLDRLPRVRSITVNTVHGQETSIAATVARFNPQVESMEGAAFAHACAISGVPYAQVRAISNVVERRNRHAWRLELAIANLNRAASGILDSL